MKTLTRSSIGLTMKQTQPLMPETEDSLWVIGVFSLNTVIGLFNLVQMFGLQAADEHQSLDIDQLNIETDTVRKY